MTEVGAVNTEPLTQDEEGVDSAIETSYGSLSSVFQDLQRKKPDLFRFTTRNVFENLRGEVARGLIDESKHKLPWPLDQKGGYILDSNSPDGNDDIEIQWQNSELTRETIKIGHHKFPVMHEHPVPFFSRDTETREKTYSGWKKDHSADYGNEFAASNHGRSGDPVKAVDFNGSEDYAQLNKVIDSLREYSESLPEPRKSLFGRLFRRGS